jgi:hypothetical protein
LSGDTAVLLVVGGAYYHIVEAEEAANLEEGHSAFEAEGFGLGGEGEDDPAPGFVAVGHDKRPPLKFWAGGDFARGKVGVAVDMDEQVDCAVFDCVSVSVCACVIDTLTQSGDYKIRLIRRQG